MDLRVYQDADSAAAGAAAEIAGYLVAALAQRGAASLAVSGGSSAPPMLAELFNVDLDWSRVGLWQVDERVAPDGDPSRNAGQLIDAPAEVHLMPVTESDLDSAARAYAATLPSTFDVVHLGMGADGHTASWPPDQPEVPVADGAVTVTEPFNGQLRMTLTESVVNEARARVVLAVGGSKAGPLQAWLHGGVDLPIQRVTDVGTVVCVDAAAAPSSDALEAD